MCFCTPGVRTPFCDSIECQNELKRLDEEEKKEKKSFKMDAIIKIKENIIHNISLELIEIAKQEDVTKITSIERYYGLTKKIHVSTSIDEIINNIGELDSYLMNHTLIYAIFDAVICDNADKHTIREIRNNIDSLLK
jgi:hypothetical protein